MLELTEHTKSLYRAHGWSQSDIEYVMENCSEVETADNWAILYGRPSDGVVWIYPVSSSNTFPVSLWKRVKEIIQENDNVVIPMNKNMDLVSRAAKKYNGYLNDNLYMFGDDMKKAQCVKGSKRCFS